MEQIMKSIEMETKATQNADGETSIFTDNPLFYQICQNISKLDASRNYHLRLFYTNEELNFLKVPKFTDTVLSILKNRFQKIDESSMTLTSQAIQKAYKYVQKILAIH